MWSAAIVELYSTVWYTPMVEVVRRAEGKRCTCRHCGSVLEYHYADITEEYVRDYTGCGDTIYSILCPVCKLKTTVGPWR